MEATLRQVPRKLLRHGLFPTPSRRIWICPQCNLHTTRSGRTMHWPSKRAATRTISNISHRRQEDSKAPAKESVLPQTHYDYFPVTLGPDKIPPKAPFRIDLQALRKEFLQLQSKAHPDLAPPDRKRQAEALSSRINEAYRALQNPLRRAQYLLQLRGIDVAEDETLKTEDPELLMEVLETRETIEEAEREEDLEGLRGTNEGRIEESERVLSEAFEQDDMQKAKEEAVRLRYWVNIRESIDGWEKGKVVVLEH